MDLETEQYKSRKFDKVFIKIRASRERLEEEAIGVGYEIQIRQAERETEVVRWATRTP